MNQHDLAQIPEMGQFYKEAIPGRPNCYRPVRSPVYVLSDAEIVYDCDDSAWMVGMYNGKKWKVRV